MSDFQVLVVEDNENDMLVICTALEKAGISYIATCSGTEALNAAITHKPEIAILDMNLPDIDGKQLCEMLQTNPETGHIKIMFLTASENVDDVLFGLHVHIAAFYFKGVRIQTVIEHIETINDDAHIRNGLNEFEQHYKHISDKYNNDTNTTNTR
ncbi:MAG: response regulator [Paraglaciecola polaris]|uniref:response regulator n=1 Tax=Paraglaciecola polaris TaxID=222814 RepID=UPI003002960E